MKNRPTDGEVLEWFKQLNSLITKSSILPEKIYAETKRARERECRLSLAMKELNGRTEEIIGDAFREGIDFGSQEGELRVNENRALDTHLEDFKKYLVLEDNDDSGD